MISYRRLQKGDISGKRFVYELFVRVLIITCDQFWCPGTRHDCDWKWSIALWRFDSLHFDLFELHYIRLPGMIDYIIYPGV
jgi:hypothetical protein